MSLPFSGRGPHSYSLMLLPVTTRNATKTQNVYGDVRVEREREILMFWMTSVPRAFCLADRSHVVTSA